MRQNFDAWVDILDQTNSIIFPSLKNGLWLTKRKMLNTNKNIDHNLKCTYEWIQIIFEDDLKKAIHKITLCMFWQNKKQDL